MKILILVLACCSFTANAQQQSQFTTKESIYVVADVHGAYQEIVSTLKTLDLIDQQENWIGGKAHFVSLGDLMDRGPASRQVMDLYMKLEIQAEKAGGKFHLLLGNHEVMNLTADLRYLSKKEIAEFSDDETEEYREKIYQQYFKKPELINDEQDKIAFNNKYPKGYFARKSAFLPTGKYGKWLLEHPFVIQINDQIFVHGGLAKQLAKYTIKELNQSLKTTLNNYINSWGNLSATDRLLFDVAFHDRVAVLANIPESEQKTLFMNSLGELLFTNESPTWYRGNSQCHPYFETDNLSSVLKKWSAKRLWVGHTTTTDRKVLSRLNQQLVMIDTGMLQSHYQGEPWAAKITKKAKPVFINGLTGKKAEAEISPHRKSPNPYKMTDLEIEAFLETAEIIKKEDLDIGITKPIKVTLKKGDKTIKAVFKYRDSKPSNEKGSWKKDIYDADRYKYEVAAYKLDRMLGIGLVPVSVERAIDGQDGVLILWINDLISSGQLKNNNIAYTGYCNFNDQVNMLDTFDYLIWNNDRNKSNILYTQDDFQLWFVDHSRSFGLSKSRPRMMKKHSVIVTKEFKIALKALTKSKLKALNPWLHSKQINAIWERRKKLLRGSF